MVERQEHDLVRNHFDMRPHDRTGEIPDLAVEPRIELFKTVSETFQRLAFHHDVRQRFEFLFKYA